MYTRIKECFWFSFIKLS